MHNQKRVSFSQWRFQTQSNKWRLETEGQVFWTSDEKINAAQFLLNIVVFKFIVYTALENYIALQLLQ